jgi:hypothetical protein
MVNELRWKSPWEMGLLEWEFETLAHEILINCETYTKAPLDSWGAVRELMNDVKRIENEVWREGNVEGERLILFELLRIAHRQFPWQQGIDKSTISRFHRIYNSPGMREIVHSEFGMTTTELFQILFALSGVFLNKPYLALPINNTINAVSAENTAAVIDRFSITIGDAKAAASNAQSHDINWAYKLNPLRLTPLLKINDDLISAPLPPLILKRLTEGLYFDLVGHRVEFDRAWGPAFQEYVGEATSRAVAGGTVSVLGEERYGSKKAPKDSVDWIVADRTGTLFIECKASRMRLVGRIDLRTEQSIVEEIGRLAAFVLQTYRTLSDALASNYPHWKPNGQPVYPVVVTLDDWQAFGDKVHEGIQKALDDGIAGGAIDAALVDNHPFSVVKIGDLEAALKIMSGTGIGPFMSGKCEGEMRTWDFHSYMLHDHKERLATIENLFADEYDLIRQLR